MSPPLWRASRSSQLTARLSHALWPWAHGPGLPASLLGLALGADTSPMVHVTGFQHVREVWQRESDFTVARYGERMRATTGDFILGMSDAARYQAESACLRQVSKRSDGDLVRMLAASETARALAPVRSRGELDVVAELAQQVPLRVAMAYFGLPFDEPARAQQLLQQVSWYIFAFWSEARLERTALEAAQRLNPIIEALVVRRRNDPDGGRDARIAPARNDVLGRLLAMEVPFPDGDQGIARSLAGLSSGTLNAPIGLFIGAANVLLELSARERRRLHELAGSEEPGDAAFFAEYVREAQRFSVFPSVLHRRAARDTSIATGTAREKRVRAGAPVVVWPSLAAFDADVIDDPFSFRLGRPRFHLMTFGHGRHRCLGEQVGQVLVTEMMRGLFSLPALQRAPGEAGQVARRPVHKATFPSSWTLVFSKHRG